MHYIYTTHTHTPSDLRLTRTMRIIPRLINFALMTVKKLSIDESHGLSHALTVLQHSHNILESEIPTRHYLTEQRDIIYTSALVHDLCDKKYMDEYKGIENIHRFLIKETPLIPSEVAVVEKIISTMSYSKVKAQGYPSSLGPYEMAYHIVREADLLSAYDVDRSIIYNMNNVNGDFSQSLQNALDLFDTRVLKHNEDGLFITDYSKKLSLVLEKNAREKITLWKEILANYE